MPPRTQTGESTTRSIGGHDVTISNPDKVLFPKPKYTKLDLVNYYLAVSDGALRGAGDRPNMLVRYPNGIGAPSFYQKRAPESRPSWIEVVTLRFPSGRTADEVVPRDPASLVWLANLACLELHPHPVRAEDLDHPDELRVDLDPVPGIKWPQVREVPKTSRWGPCRSASPRSAIAMRAWMTAWDRSRVSSSCQRTRKRKGRAMRRGRPTTANNRVSRRGCSRPSHGPGRRNTR